MTLTNSYNELFDAYENMYSRSEIEDEIAEMELIIGAEPDLSQDAAIDDLDGIVEHHYMSGYAAALRWVVGLQADGRETPERLTT